MHCLYEPLALPIIPLAAQSYSACEQDAALIATCEAGPCEHFVTVNMSYESIQYTVCTQKHVFVFLARDFA